MLPKNQTSLICVVLALLLSISSAYVSPKLRYVGKEEDREEFSYVVAASKPKESSVLPTMVEVGYFKNQADAAAAEAKRLKDEIEYEEKQEEEKSNKQKKIDACAVCSQAVAMGNALANSDVRLISITF